MRKVVERKNSFALFSMLVCAALIALLGGCAKNPPKPGDMAFNDLKTRAMTFLEKGRRDEAIVHFEQLIAQYPENQDIYEYKFILADLYLKAGRLAEAYNMYRHYTKMYPSSDQAEEAHYKSILAKFYQTLKVSKSCDDTDTQHTIKQCEAYLTNILYAKYVNDVKDVLYTCEQRLIDKEIYVFNTYLRRKKFQSAKNRIEHLKTAYLENHPKLEAQILYLESKLAHKQRNSELAQKKADVLVEKFPESRFTKMAHSMIRAKKKTFTF